MCELQNEYASLRSCHDITFTRKYFMMILQGGFWPPEPPVCYATVYLIFHFGLLTSKKKLIRLAESYFFIDRSYLWKRLLFIIRLIV